MNREMDWIMYLQQIRCCFEKKGVEVFLLQDRRCRGNMRLFFEDNIDGYVSDIMREKYPSVKYTLATESEELRKKFRRMRSEATLNWLQG